MTPGTSTITKKKIRGGWSNEQKALFAQACKAIGYGPEQRHMILSGFRNAFDPRGGKDHPSSTSKRLNNSDFEHAMAAIESVTPGQRIAIGTRRYATLHWRRKADDDLARMRSLASRLADQLVRSGTFTKRDALKGWISQRITDGRTDRLEQLNYTEVYNLIEGLKAFGRRHGVTTY